MFARRPFRRLRRLLSAAPAHDPAGAPPRRPPECPYCGSSVAGV